MQTFAIATLGCRANQADSDRLRAILLDAGFEERPFGTAVDCAIVNTCTVTAEADRKSRQQISRALKVASGAGKVVATGCGAAARGGLGRVPGSVLRLPPEQRESILTLLQAEACPGREAMVSVGCTTRALLKVQDGCDQFCTFCIVPYVRGRSRSIPLAQVVDEAVQLEGRGYGEVVLTGIHLSTWGHDQPGEPDLGNLVQAILEATTRLQVRLASLEPDRFPVGLLDLIERDERLCPYLHLVLQHASDPVLQRMHRGYDLASYDRLVTRFMAASPMATLSSDIMVGFPGETEEDFQTLLAYLERTPYYHLHVFPYSPRAGTSASKFKDQVAGRIKLRRRDELLSLAQKKRYEAMQRVQGMAMTVIIEGEHNPGWLKGTAFNGMAMIVEAPLSYLKRRVPVRVVGIEDSYLVGGLDVDSLGELEFCDGAGRT